MNSCVVSASGRSKFSFHLKTVNLNKDKIKNEFFITLTFHNKLSDLLIGCSFSTFNGILGVPELWTKTCLILHQKELNPALTVSDTH